MKNSAGLIGLRAIRKERKLNQLKVALDLNISREALSHYENGKRIYMNIGDNSNGIFKVKIDGATYNVIVSNGGGWEHVSVSNEKHIPSWKVMCKIKDLFFFENETLICNWED